MPSDPDPIEATVHLTAEQLREAITDYLAARHYHAREIALPNIPKAGVKVVVIPLAAPAAPEPASADATGD